MSDARGHRPINGDDESARSNAPGPVRRVAALTGRLYDELKGRTSPLSLADGTRMNARRQRMHELQRMADRVCVLILSSDLPAIDIEIEKNKVRERCLELYPNRGWLYDTIYESRFDRLWEQFREEADL